MKGFTLVEMLVALLIFGMLAAAGVTVMRSSVQAQSAMRARVDQLGDFQRLRAMLKADLSQSAVRRTRGPGGALSPSAFSGGDVDGAGPLIALTRRGWENPNGAPRASLQYVEYRVVDGRLERHVRRGLDGAALDPPQVLYEGVESVAVSFLARQGWRAVWDGAADLPEAVRLDMKLTGMGEISQMFLTPAAAR